MTKGTEGYNKKEEGEEDPQTIKTKLMMRLQRLTTPPAQLMIPPYPRMQIFISAAVDKYLSLEIKAFTLQTTKLVPVAGSKRNLATKKTTISPTVKMILRCPTR